MSNYAFTREVPLKDILRYLNSIYPGTINLNVEEALRDYAQILIQGEVGFYAEVLHIGINATVKYNITVKE